MLLAYTPLDFTITLLAAAIYYIMFLGFEGIIAFLRWILPCTSLSEGAGRRLEGRVESGDLEWQRNESFDAQLRDQKTTIERQQEELRRFKGIVQTQEQKLNLITKEKIQLEQMLQGERDRIAKALESEKKQHQKTVIKARSDIAKLQGHIAAKNEEIEDTAVNDDVERQHTESFDAQLKYQKTVIEKQQEELNRLKEMVQAQEQKFDAITKEKIQLERILQDTKGERDRATKALESAKKQHQKTIVQAQSDNTKLQDHIAAKNEEIKNAAVNIDVERHHNESLDAQLKDRKTTIERQQEELNRLKEIVQAREQKFDAITKEKIQLERMLQDTKGERDKTAKALESAKKQHQKTVVQTQSDITKLQDHIAAKNEEIDTLKQDSNKIREEKTKIAEVLKARTLELTDAIKFSKAPDGISGADVIKKVNNLNEMIFQMAAAAESHFSFAPSTNDIHDLTSLVGPDHGLEYILEVKKRITESLGEMLTDLVLSRYDLQLAVQAKMCDLCYQIIGSWCPTVPMVDAFLRQTYNVLCSNEGQRTISSWRKLTRQHAQHLLSPDIIQQELSESFVTAFEDLLLLAGAGAGEKETLRSRIQTRYGANIDLIIRSVLELNKIIGQDVSSCDYIAVCYKENATFDASFMEPFSTRVPKDQLSGQTILCTTTLGLQRTVKEENRVMMTMILKPKVVMSYEVQELAD